MDNDNGVRMCVPTLELASFRLYFVSFSEECCVDNSLRPELTMKNIYGRYLKIREYS